MILKDIRPSLDNIVSTMSNLTNLEYAIFDADSHLITSTRTYLKRKGRTVHSASIEEVLTQGNIVVNKPGHMKSCIGCRFVNNCPSTIEILSCIKINSIPIGVVSMTSFSQERHVTIEKNISNYVEIIDYISNLISMFASNESSKKDSQILHNAIDELITNEYEYFLLIDANGMLIYCNKGTNELLPYCDLFAQSIYQILPKDVSDWILSVKKPIKRYFSLNTFNGLIYVSPLTSYDEVIGYSLKFEKDKVLSVSTNFNYLEKIISNDNIINEIKRKIIKLSTSSSSVLITGKTGTGKEMIAEAIHYTSNRKDNPFIPINCANIPDSLFESELFGYEEGAFTGAKKGGKQGIFELANSRTIFLDEIGELPLYLQAKLLRVLQNHTIQRLGSITPIPIDIRVIAATNRDLEEMIEENKFREDLFYRLNVIQIHLPPLIKRIGDIELLSNHFINVYNKRLNKKISSLSDEALETLKSYSWPGNIRELENCIEYALNMEETKIIQVSSLPTRITHYVNSNSNIKDRVSETEYQLIINALDKNGWDVKGKEKAAKELGLSLRTLYRKLKM